MKPINTICIALISKLFLFVGSVAHAEENPYVINLEKERIHMPTVGVIQHRIPNDHPHISTFAGPIALSGTVKIYWYDSITDDSDINNLKYKKSWRLIFSHQLPHWETCLWLYTTMNR